VAEQSPSPVKLSLSWSCNV